MASPTNPKQVRALLAAQHAALRAGIARCEQLADGLDAGGVDVAALLREVTELRRSFDVHNQLEERMLRPVLLDADWLGEVRVARMVEDHVEEHRALRGDLDASTSWELRRVLTSLRDHLDAEERYFLTRSEPRGVRAR